MNILVTGAGGFVGKALCRRLGEAHDIHGVDRRLPPDPLAGAARTTLAEIGPDMDWSAILPGTEAVVHLAARAHLLRDTAADPLAEFRKTNRDGTQTLAEAAARQGVRRFVFISTIGVNGNVNRSCPDGLPVPFTEDDPPSPHDPYSVSKWEAEEILREIGARTGMEIVILRPPLVYGPGVPGNFYQLLRWVDRAVPLPLGSVHNRRSLIGLNNLVDLLARCAEHPAAAGELFIAGEGESLSTTELLRRLARAMRRRSLLYPVSDSAFRAMTRALGQERLYDRLFASLAVSNAKACARLDWQPPSTIDEEVGRTVAWYLGQR